MGHQLRIHGTLVIQKCSIDNTPLTKPRYSTLSPLHLCAGLFGHTKWLLASNGATSLWLEHPVPF